MNRNGRCTESLRTNVTREECCSDGSATTAWSPKDLRSGDLFFWMSLGGGVVCKACKGKFFLTFICIITPTMTM